MNKLELKLVDESLDVWRKKLRQRNPELIVVGGDGCPLCQQFGSADCDGCPIKDFTGYPQCEDTPYCQAAGWLVEWKIAEWKKSTSDTNMEDSQKARRRWCSACRAEIRFLESVKQNVKETNEATVEVAGRVD